MIGTSCGVVSRYLESEKRIAGIHDLWRIRRSRETKTGLSPVNFMQISAFRQFVSFHRGIYSWNSGGSRRVTRRGCTQHPPRAFMKSYISPMYVRTYISCYLFTTTCLVYLVNSSSNRAARSQSPVGLADTVSSSFFYASWINRETIWLKFRVNGTTKRSRA